MGPKTGEKDQGKKEAPPASAAPQETPREAKPRKSKKGACRIDIYRGWCKGCGICAAFCPMGVLGRDEAGYPVVKALDKCIRCGWCEVRCPDFAISVETAPGEAEDGNA
jgi:2-oxoglutarate ferredoxin oxidoreductase subunit delta